MAASPRLSREGFDSTERTGIVLRGLGKFVLAAVIAIGLGYPISQQVLARQAIQHNLIDSLDDQAGDDKHVRAELTLRLERLKSGADTGLSFEEIFGKPL